MSQKPADILEKHLQKGQGRFSVTEAVAATGLGIDMAKDGLSELYEKYICRVQVTEKAELIYDFGNPLQRRDQKSSREILDDILGILWKWFVLAYRFMIAVVLVVYFVVFIVLFIVLLLMALTRGGSSKNSGSSSGSSGSGGFHSSSRSSSGKISDINSAFTAFGRFFSDIFDWNTVTGAYYYETDQRGYRYRHAEPKKSRLDPDKKRFVTSVYDYVFGPPRYPIDPFSNEKEVARFLQENKGLITIADLIVLAGWTASEAHKFFTDCLIRFHGEVKVTDNGVVYGEFDQVSRSIGIGDGGDIIYYWDEYEPEYELNGNTTPVNSWITLLNGFNLIFSFLVVTDLLETIMQKLITPDTHELALAIATWLIPYLVSDHWGFNFFLGWFPLIFSTLFFIVPYVRWRYIRKAGEERHENNIRKRLYCACFYRAKGAAQLIQKITNIVNNMTTEEKLSKKIVDKRMSLLILDLDGEMVVDESGDILYSFPRIESEFMEISKLREGKEIDYSSGEIIADTDGI